MWSITKKHKHKLNKQTYRSELNECLTYDEYKLRARNVDYVLGNDSWKREPESELYDSQLIQVREC